MGRRLGFWALALAVVILLTGVILRRELQPPGRLPAVPETLTQRAEIPGIPGARYWIGMDLEPFVRDVLAAREREREFLARSGHTGPLPPADLLAVSGGGDKGAFGAGLLNGWSASGSRPRFKVVTGISTGALIAPFAFLGADFDPELRKNYTEVAQSQIASKRGVLAAVNNDAMADNRPLGELISRSIDRKFLDRIAEEYKNGRLLLIGTTDLDARQPVIWNMGIIASSTEPRALELFRSILLASAAIPGAFPPTMVEVEVDGHSYSEMHVDGGTSAQVFLYPPSLREAAAGMGEELSRPGRVYIIRNSYLRAAWSPVQRRTVSIGMQAVGSLIHTQGMGDLYRIYLTTQRDGFDFNLAYIDPDFKYEAEHEDFDPKYMKALYDYGYRLGRQGYPWKKAPPGLESPLGT